MISDDNDDHDNDDNKQKKEYLSLNYRIKLGPVAKVSKLKRPA